MRKFVGGFVLLLILLVVGVAIAVANLDTYLNENKAWVEEQVEAALVRPVSFEEVGLSFSRGLGVRIAGFRIGEDPDYGEGDFFSVDEATVNVAIWPALFGRIEVTKIGLRGASLNVINDVFGMSTDTLGGAKPDPGVDAGAPPPAEEGEGGSAVEEFIVAVAEIRGGTVRYIDRTSDPVARVEIERLDFTATDVGLERPFVFRLTGELLGEDEDRSNLSIEGQYGPLPQLPDVPTPLDVRFEIDPINMAGLRQLPGLRDAVDPNLPIEGTMKLAGRASGHVERPVIELDLDATDALLSWSEEGRKNRGVPLQLAFDVGMNDRDVMIRSADFTVAGVVAHLEGQVKNLDDPTVDLVMEVFDGRIDLDGGWKADGALALDAKIQQLDLGAMTRALASAGVKVVDGKLNMSLALSGTGTTIDQLLSVIEGAGEISIEGGVLHDVNLVQAAVSGFDSVPGLAAKLEEKFADDYPVLFNTGDTEFETLRAGVEVRDGKLHIAGIDVDVSDFALRGKGTLSLVGELDLGTKLSLSKKLSKALIDEAKPLKYLRDDDGRIEVPIQIAGALPSLSAKPDVDRIASRLGAGAADGLVEKGEKKLDKALDKALGKFTKKSKKKKKKKRAEESDPGAEEEQSAPADVDGGAEPEVDADGAPDAEPETDVDEEGREILEDLLE